MIPSRSAGGTRLSSKASHFVCYLASPLLLDPCLGEGLPSLVSTVRIGLVSSVCTEVASAVERAR